MIFWNELYWVISILNNQNKIDCTIVSRNRKQSWALSIKSGCHKQLFSTRMVGERPLKGRLKRFLAEPGCSFHSVSYQLQSRTDDTKVPYLNLSYSRQRATFIYSVFYHGPQPYALDEDAELPCQNFAETAATARAYADAHSQQQFK